MNTEFNISAWIYGLVIISNSQFTKLRKDYKIRAKKMLTYFANHNEIGNDFAQQGAVIPIHGINNYDYTIFYGTQIDSNISTEWVVAKNFGNFNLSIGDDNCFWVAQLNELEEWDNEKLIGVNSLTEQVYSHENELQNTYRAVKVNFTKGCYDVVIYGLKRKVPKIGKIEQKMNYGFFLELKLVDKLGISDDATEVDFSFFD